MILYVGASLYHILCFAVHKRTYRPEEEAILVIGDNIFSKSGMKELKADIVEAEIFDRVEILHFIEGAYKNPYHLKPESPTSKVDQFIAHNEVWVEQWMEQKKIKPDKIREFYSAIDHRHLGLYLLSKGFPYYYFEDGNGLLSRKQVQLEFHKNAQYASYAVTTRLGALGENSHVIKKYANMQAQEPEFYDEKAEDFSVISLIGQMDPFWRSRIIAMFHGKILPKETRRPVLYLTRYVRYLKNPDIRSHHLLSALLLDLFAKDSPVIIKPHPRDFSGRYKDLFPEALVLEKHFPSELLPFLYEGTYKKIITTGSTAADGLAEYTDEIINIDLDLKHQQSRFYGYIAALQLTADLLDGLSDGFAVTGCAMELMDPLSRLIVKQEPKLLEEHKKHWNVVIVDQMPEFFVEADVVIYINGENDYKMARDPDIQYMDVHVLPEGEAALGKPVHTAIYAKTENEFQRIFMEKYRWQQRFQRCHMEFFVGNCSRMQRSYGSLMAQMIYKKYHGEVKIDAFQVPEHVEQMDLETMKDVLNSYPGIAAGIKRENTIGRNEYESYSICANEIK
jgi:hypothetical protein